MRIERKYSPHHTTIEKYDEKGNHCQSRNLANKSTEDQEECYSVNNTACSEVKRITGKQPKQNSIGKVNGPKDFTGNILVVVEQQKSQQNEWNRVAKQMSEISMEQGRSEYSRESVQGSWVK